MNDVRRRQLIFTVFYVLASAGLLWAFQRAVTEPTDRRNVPYSELLKLVRDGKVEAAELRTDTVQAVLKQDTEQRKQVVTAERLPGIEERALLDELVAAGVSVSGKIERPSFLSQLLISMAPILLLVGIYWFGFRQMQKQAGPLSVGKSKARIFDANAKPEDRVTFADVAGVDESKGELQEVIEFLRSPAKYEAVGARVPKGVLLVGPPGTGKTLLARAVAGEAGVPFFSTSGSEFVEMFVGVGAARMRDMFEQAKKRAPCIVFIDELDAIGKSRGGQMAFGSHDEREQTLNQFLVEMDGFDASSGVIIMAATNRPEVLDQALVRAGRFDRQVVVDRPDVTGRQAILEVHAKKVVLDPAVNLGVVARRTVGMVGADLANAVNEAALAAARRGGDKVTTADFEEAIDRLQLGLKKRGRVMNDEEKRRVALHESGHALVALSVKNADPVHRVTIIPRSIGALGVTLQLPTEDRYLVTQAELEDRIAVMLGGRVAEQLALGDVSTGAQNDLERATETARQMVCRFGMSPLLGPLTFGQPAGLRFLQTPAAFGGEERNFSERTAQTIDDEVRRIVETQHQRATKLLSERQAVLTRMAERLLQDETLEQPVLLELVGPVPAAADRPAA